MSWNPLEWFKPSDKRIVVIECEHGTDLELYTCPYCDGDGYIEMKITKDENKTSEGDITK